MPLNGVVVYIDYFLEQLKGHISYVILFINEEPAQDVDAHHSKTLVGLDPHYSASTFREH